MTEKVILNSAKCLLCNDVLISMYRHDFRVCSCGNLFVDGGYEYTRKGCSEGWDTIEDLSEYEDAQVSNSS